MEVMGQAEHGDKKPFNKDKRKTPNTDTNISLNNPITKAARPAPLVLSLMIKRLLQVFQKIIIWYDWYMHNI